MQLSAFCSNVVTLVASQTRPNKKDILNTMILIEFLPEASPSWLMASQTACLLSQKPLNSLQLLLPHVQRQPTSRGRQHTSPNLPFPFT